MGTESSLALSKVLKTKDKNIDCIKTNCVKISERFDILLIFLSRLTSVQYLPIFYLNISIGKRGGECGLKKFVKKYLV